MMRMMPLSWIVILTLFRSALTYEINVSNGGTWGGWGSLEPCPIGTVATGFQLLVEPAQNIGDDTALNGIRLYCNPPGRKDTQTSVTSKTGRWGKWLDILWCPTGFLVIFRLKVEKPQGPGDDTAANNIIFQCSDDTILEGYGGKWGEYGGWSGRCNNGIDAIKTRVEDSQGPGDDTALNDVVFRCR